MESTEEAGARGTPSAPQVWRDLYATRWALLAAVLFALSCWGTWDGFHDAEGERWWAVVPMAAPAVLTIAYLLPAAWRPGATAQDLTARFLVTGFAAVVPLAVLNVLFLIAAWVVPSNRAEVRAAAGHYWWEGGLGQQIVMTGLGGWVGGMLGALFVFMVVILPVLAIRRPDLVAQGSHLTRIGGRRQRHNAVAFVYVGLAVCMVGLIAMAVTEGVGGADDFIRRVRLMIRSGIDAEWLAWSVGWLMFVGGILAMAYPVLRVALIRAGLLGGGERGERGGRSPDDGGAGQRGAGPGADGAGGARSGWPKWPLLAGAAAVVLGLVLLASWWGGIGYFTRVGLVLDNLGNPGFEGGAIVWLCGWALVVAGAAALAYSLVLLGAALFRRRRDR